MIIVKDMTVQAGDFRLEHVNLAVPAGEYAVLMGKTGCGKTTILESILGLRKVQSGTILLYDEDVTNLNPAARGVGYVPQDGALFSQMTVRDHLAFALFVRRARKQAIERRVAELSDLLGISHLLDRTPLGLSGGERQRVALGRALSFRPKVLCLDEPLSALDTQTRQQMCELLISVRERTGVTTLHVTHNLEEAQALADCWFQIEGGNIRKVEHKKKEE